VLQEPFDEPEQQLRGGAVQALGRIHVKALPMALAS